MLIEITNQCNEGCPHCLNSSLPNGGMMSETTFKNAVAFAIKHKISLIHLSGGEPFLNPNIGKWIRYIGEQFEKRRIPLLLIITTNGTWCLDEKSLKKAKNVINSQYVKEVIVNSNKKYYKHYDEVCDFFKKNFLPKTKLYKDWQGIVTNLIKLGRGVNIAEPVGHPHCYDIKKFFLDRVDTGESFDSIIKKWFSRGKSCAPAIDIFGNVRLGPSRFCKPIFNINQKEPDLNSAISEFEPCNRCGRVSVLEFAEKIENMNSDDKVFNVNMPSLYIDKRTGIDCNVTGTAERFSTNFAMGICESMLDADDKKRANATIYLYTAITLFAYIEKLISVDTLDYYIIDEEKDKFKNKINRIKNNILKFRAEITAIYSNDSPMTICEEYFLPYVRENSDFIKKVNSLTSYMKKKYKRFNCQADELGILVSVINVLFDRFVKILESNPCKEYGYSKYVNMSIIKDLIDIANQRHFEGIESCDGDRFDKHEASLLEDDNSVKMTKETKPLFELCDWFDTNLPKTIVNAMLFYNYAELRNK